MTQQSMVWSTRLGRWGAIAIVVVALLLTAVRLLTPFLQLFEQDIQQQLTIQLQRDVRFSHFTAQWQGFGPVITLEEVAIGRNASAVTAKKLVLAFNGWQLFRDHRWQPSGAKIFGLVLPVLETEAGRWQIAGRQWRNALPQQTGFNLPELTVVDSTVMLQKASGVSLLLSHLSGDLQRQQQGYKLTLQVPTQAHGLSLTLNSDFKFVQGGFGTQGRLYLKGKDNNLAHWSSWVSAMQWGQITQGQLQGELWLQWDQQQLQSLQTQFALTDVALTHSVVPASHFPVNFSANIAVIPDPLGWKIQGDQLEIAWAGKSQPTSQFQIQLQPTSAHTRVVLQSDRVALQGLMELVALSGQLSPEQAKQWTSLQLEGQLQAITASALVTPQKIEQLELSAGFQDVNWQSGLHWPGGKHLNGSLAVTPTKAAFHVATENFELSHPHWWSKSLPPWQLSGQLLWQQQAQGWQLETSTLQVKNKDIQLTALGKVNEHDGGLLSSATLNFSPFEANKLVTYWPLWQLTPHLSAWLQQAVLQGQIDHLQLAFDGPVVATNKRWLTLSADYHHGVVAFAPDWPALSLKHAQLQWSPQTFQATIEQGTLAGLSLQPTTVVVPMVHKKETPTPLKVTTSAEASLPSFMQALAKMPLPRLAASLDTLEMEGKGKLALSLTLPLLPDHHLPAQVSGVLFTDNAVITPKKSPLRFEQVAGQWHFTEKSVRAEGLTGQLWGQPITATMTSEKDKVTELVLKGLVEMSQLTHHYPITSWGALAGRAEAKAIWQHYPQAQQPDSLRIQSQLKGVSSRLPAPLSKEAAEQQPLTFMATFGENHQTDYRLELPQRLIAELQTHGQSGQQIFKRGQLQLGASSAETPWLLHPSGLVVTGHLATIDGMAWRQQWQEWMEQRVDSDGHFFSWPQDFVTANVQIDQLGFVGRQWRDLHIAVSHRQAWDIAVAAPQLSGKISWPDNYPSVPIEIDLTRCQWPEQPSPSNWSPDHNSVLPTLHFSCQQTQYQQRVLGRLSFNMAPLTQGVKLEQILLEGDHYQVAASGQWLYQPQQQTHLEGTVEAQQINDLLRAFNVYSDQLEGRGTSAFSLNWQAPWWALAAPSLTGYVEFSLQQGRLVKVEPGVGRVISLFNFQSLQRRLQLDFSDLFQQGLAFDTATGQVVFKQGMAYSDNIALDGSSAAIEAKGHFDLVKKQTDLTINVSSHVSETLPLAAVVATGNPAVGAAVWVVDRFLSPDMGTLARYRYRVTGSWQQPDIKRQPLPSPEALTGSEAKK